MRKYNLSKVLCIVSLFNLLAAMQSENPARLSAGDFEARFDTEEASLDAQETPLNFEDAPELTNAQLERARAVHASICTVQIAASPYHNYQIPTTQPSVVAPLHADSAGAVVRSEGISGWIKENPGKSRTAALTAAQAAALIIAYKKNEKFKTFVDKSSNTTKHYIVRNVALPVAMKIEEIKTEGFSRFDILKGVLFGLGCYGMKKTGDYFHLWSGIRSMDFTKTREKTSSFLGTLYDHKKKIIAGVVCVATAFWLYKFSQSVNKQAKVQLLDQFFLSFTTEQRIEIMKVPELSKLVSEAAEDPLLLQLNENFMRILSETQKKKLNDAVEDYIKNNVPLAFLESDLL